MTPERRERLTSERSIIDGYLTHPRAPHGTSGGYTNWMCRCRPCKDAFAASMKRSRMRRMAERTVVNGVPVAVAEGVEHGKPCTYTNHRCKCRPCLDAHAEYCSSRKRVSI